MVNRDSLLATCLGRLAWSPERLAREVNKVAGPGTISAKAPYGWLNGSCPRGPVPHVVAEVLSAHLAVDIVPSELWPDAAIRARFNSLADDGLTSPWTQDGAKTAAAAMSAKAQDFAGFRTHRTLPGPRLTDHARNWLSHPPEAFQPNFTGESLTPEMVEALEVRVFDLRRMDDARGGTVVLDWAAHDLSWASQLIGRAAYDIAMGVRLHRAVAELAQLAGWLACDAERHAEAQRYWLLGLRAAHVIDDTQLGANIVSCMSYQAVWQNQPPEALSLIRLAGRGLGPAATGTVRALVRTREARTHALLGNTASCERALVHAQELIHANRGDDPSWIYWVTPAVLAGDAGRAWLDLGHSLRAEESLTECLLLFGDDQPRNRMLHNASLAEARLARGEVDGAAEAAHSALDLTTTMNSRRAAQRLAELGQKFHDKNSVVAHQVADRIHASRAEAQ